MRKYKIILMEAFSVILRLFKLLQNRIKAPNKFKIWARLKVKCQKFTVNNSFSNCPSMGRTLGITGLGGDRIKMNYWNMFVSQLPVPGIKWVPLLWMELQRPWSRLSNPSRTEFHRRVHDCWRCSRYRGWQVQQVIFLLITITIQTEGP